MKAKMGDIYTQACLTCLGDAEGADSLSGVAGGARPSQVDLAVQQLELCLV
jgi:hypothetical protein